MSETNEKRRKPKMTFIFVLILLIISLAFNGILINKQKTSEKAVVTSKDRIDSLIRLEFNISQELLQTSQDLDNYKGITSNLDSLLVVANTKIETQKQRINDLFNQNLSQKQLKKKLESELAELKKFKDIYLDKVDSLILQNQTLQASNIKLNEDLQIIESEKEVLVAKVDLASILKIKELIAVPLKKKKSGKLVETALAKKTKILKTCFDIEENLIAEKSKKDVHLKITGPQGVVLFLDRFGSGIFRTSEGKDSKYTMLKTIDYTQSQQNVCFDWQQDHAFSSGQYSIDIYIEYILIGSATFELK